MRLFGLVLTALILSAVSALAQTPPATPPSAGSQATLDRYLSRWEQEMRKLQSLAAQLTRIDKDKTFETTTKLVGYAHYLKAGTGPSTMNLAQMELRIDGKPDIAEKVIVTGTHLYQYVPTQKEIRYMEMPKPKPGQVSEDSFLGLLFGMKAQEARRRYVLNLAKEDTYYIYVDITPRFREDRGDFKRARLVLNKENFLPRQLWFEHPNGNETTWDIPRLQPGVALDRRAFDAPRPPAGWKLVPSTPPAPAPSGAPPRPAAPVPAGRPAGK